MGKFNKGNTKASKLTGERVLQIRTDYSTGEFTQAELARREGVSLTTIRNVIAGVTWQQLPTVKSDDEILGEQALLNLQAKQSEERMKRLLGMGELEPEAKPVSVEAEPPTNVGERFAADLQKAVELNNELEALKGEGK